MDDERPADETAIACPECHSRDIERDEVRGEVVCQNCGLVIEDNVIDQTRGVSSREQAVQGPRSGVDYAGKSLLDSKRAKYLLRLDRRHPKTSQERSLIKAKYHIKGICISLGQTESDFRAAAIECFKKVQGKGIMRSGRVVHHFSAACTYVAFLGVHLSVDEISAASHVDARSIKLAFRHLQEMGLVSSLVPLSDPQNYLVKIHSKLEPLPEYKVVTEAYKLWEVVGSEVWLWQGKDHNHTAAALLYITSRTVEPPTPITIKDICAASGTSAVTLRKRRKLIESILETVA